MKVKSFYIPKEKMEIETLLSDDRVDVKKIITWNTDNLHLLVLYKTKDETAYDEGARLVQVKEVVESIRDDQVYSELKNVNQRYLYLLDKYHIPKHIALDAMDEVIVQELIKLKVQI